jgi:hypothetical protein
MILDETLWEIFYDIEGEVEISEGDETEEDTVIPTVSPLSPLRGRVLPPANSHPTPSAPSSTPTRVIAKPLPRVDEQAEQYTCQETTKQEVIGKGVFIPSMRVTPLVQRLRKGEPFPWKEAWFYLCSWLPGYLIQHLTQRITVSTDCNSCMRTNGDHRL